MSDMLSTHLANWQRCEELAEAILPKVGALYRKHAVVVAVAGTSLLHKTPVQIITLHEEASLKAASPLDLADTSTVLDVMLAMEPGRARVDVGKLILRFHAAGASDLAAWTREQLSALGKADLPLPSTPQDVVLYGFGRIGRLVARILIDKAGGGDKYRLRGIVLRQGSAEDLARRASLLERDSVHGPFKGTIRVDADNDALIVNGNLIRIIYADAPETIDYTAYGIHDAVVIDNTGKWRDQAGLGRHLLAKGVAKALLTAPGKGMPNVVFGINDGDVTPDVRLVSAASCTTNAIVPVLKVLNDRYGIVRGHVETVHAYTNDQNLTDNFHKKTRRGRGAPLNMVITETGAAKAVAVALPELAGKLTGNAIRVPTPNVSLAILNLQLGRATTTQELNAHLRQISLDSPFSAQIDYTTSHEVVSSDMVGNPHAGIVDSQATIVRDDSAVLYVWYDNEFGYSCQVVRLMQKMAGVSPRVFP